MLLLLLCVLLLLLRMLRLLLGLQLLQMQLKRDLREILNTRSHFLAVNFNNRGRGARRGGWHQRFVQRAHCAHDLCAKT